MAILCKPAIHLPEHQITQEQTLELCRRLHADHPQLPLALRLIANTGVQRRHLVQPLPDTLTHPGFQQRNGIHQQQAEQRVPGVVLQALANAHLGPDDIDMIIYVSCTGFSMPSLTAWLINNLGFRLNTTQLPIAQLGCAAGGAAINRAADYCRAHPLANVLIVSCELCSLCYQPTDTAIGNLLSNGLFGDAVAAAVVRGQDGTGIRIHQSASYLMPGTESWISYQVKDTGFHFQLDKRVPRTMEGLAPPLHRLAADYGWDASKLDLYIIHAGGPRILDDLTKHLQVPPEAFTYSRQTLANCGNIASAVVLDALARAFDDQAVTDGDTCLLAGFGPGITAEACIGTWVTHSPHSDMHALADQHHTRPLSLSHGSHDPAPAMPPLTGDLLA
ncbi:type III polyketide synthase [Sphaerisporangium album]|uniref:Type III polyketide synthase n=1 Tax=Sphaerisporangium album TaxID=509200 RepID=A0A367ELV7_9ACTN|nr:type III polyketide synthase [Sphaerisporangium album]RCG19021.1 type III polyketide synthase [Sphaerisporangium album]